MRHGVQVYSSHHCRDSPKAGGLSRDFLRTTSYCMISVEITYWTLDQIGHRRTIVVNIKADKKVE